MRVYNSYGHCPTVPMRKARTYGRVRASGPTPIASKEWKNVHINISNSVRARSPLARFEILVYTERERERERDREAIYACLSVHCKLYATQIGQRAAQSFSTVW